MAYLMRDETLIQLGKGGSFLFGDPDKDGPLLLLDLASGAGWSPLVPAEIARNLLEAGLIALKRARAQPENGGFGYHDSVKFAVPGNA